MDDLHLGRGEEEEGGGNLLRKLSREVERDAAKVGVAQQVVEVVGEEFEDEAEMVAPHEMVPEFHHVVFVLKVGTVHHFCSKWRHVAPLKISKL